MPVRPRRLIVPLLVLASFASGPVHATITPDARRVVDAYLEVTGGRAAFEAERTLHAKGTILARGLTGSFETWSQAPGRTLTVIRLGAIQIDAGCDGSVAWRTDLTARRVEILEGEELESAVADAYFQNELWARPDQGGGQVTVGGQAFGDEGIEQSLQVSPPEGGARRLWFSQKSGHLIRIAAPRADGEWIDRLSDFRRSAGRVRSHACESGNARIAASYERLQVDSTWANEPIDSTRFAPPKEPVSSVGWLERRTERRMHAAPRTASVRQASMSASRPKPVRSSATSRAGSTAGRERCTCGAWIARGSKCRRCL
jgi:hypothetical protein